MFYLSLLHRSYPKCERAPIGEGRKMRVRSGSAMARRSDRCLAKVEACSDRCEIVQGRRGKILRTNDRGVSARGVLHRQVLAPNVLKNSGPLIVELHT